MQSTLFGMTRVALPASCGRTMAIGTQTTNPMATTNLFIGVNSFGFNQFAAANDITLLDQDFTVNSITLGNGADIVNSANGGTTSFEIQVNFHVNVGNGTGTSVITLYDAPGIFLESLDANTMNIANGGQVTLNSINAASPELAILEVDNGLLDVQSGGTLFGNGLVRMADNPGAPTTLLRNDGTITAGFSNGFGGIFGPAATKLQILANNGNARFDWDGGGNGILQVNPNATLDIDVRPGASGSNDDFSGTMNLTTGSTIDIAHAWAVDSATINVNTGAFGLIIIGQDPNPGPAAHIAGANWTMSGGTINIADSWDSLQLDSQLTSTGGTIANSGHLIFNNDATIGSGTDFQMNGASASLTVAAGATVVVNDASFNADGNGNTTNVLTVNSGGRLDINLGAGAEEKLDGVINLNGGRLDLTTASNTWTMDRDLNLANVAGTGASVVGETMHVGNDGGALDANVNVTGAGASFIFAPAVFNSDADVNIAAGATLQTSTVTFESVNGANNARYQGTGKWRFAGTTTVNEATTLDMAGGTVDLDNSDSFFGAARDTFVNAPLTINAATMQSFGDSSLNAFPIPPSITDLNIDNLGADTGILTVNLDNPSDEWTINSIGVMNLTNGNGAQTLLAGSDVNVEGTVNVNGDVRTAARMDITGTVNINTAGQPLHLNGGNSTTDPNTLAGGTINGPGSIASDSRALHGFGTINAPVAFGNWWPPTRGQWHSKRQRRHPQWPLSRHGGQRWHPQCHRSVEQQRRRTRRPGWRRITRKHRHQRQWRGYSWRGPDLGSCRQQYQHQCSGRKSTAQKSNRVQPRWSDEQWRAAGPERQPDGQLPREHPRQFPGNCASRRGRRVFRRQDFDELSSRFEPRPQRRHLSLESHNHVRRIARRRGGFRLDD